jgi:predicted GNAT superfamily acetyltransferase
MYGDAAWLSVILAVANGHRQQGKARALKQALIGEAQKAGVKVITSIVDWNNAAMLALNHSLGGSVTKIVTGFVPDEDFCRSIVPVR